MLLQPASLLASLSILSHGVAADGLQLLSTNAPVTETLPELVAHRIQLDLAERLNISARNIVIEKATPQTWDDHCLSLAKPNESCTQGDKQGWQVEVESPYQTWIYRSDRTATQLRLEPLPNSTDLNQADFSAAVSQMLLEAASQQVQHPAESLQISEVHAAILRAAPA